MTKRNGTDFDDPGHRHRRLHGVQCRYRSVVNLFGAVAFVPLFVLLNLLRGLSSLWLPNFRAPPREETVAAAAPAFEAARLGEVMKPWFLLPLVGSSIIFSTHIILNAFGAAVEGTGIPEAIIGPLIALGVAEAATMYAYRRFGGKFSARTLIIVSALSAVFRWGAMAFAAGWRAGLPVLLQSLTLRSAISAPCISSPSGRARTSRRRCRASSSCCSRRPRSSPRPDPAGLVGFMGA